MRGYLKINQTMCRETNHPNGIQKGVPLEKIGGRDKDIDALVRNQMNIM
jgi:hypothetical protein